MFSCGYLMYLFGIFLSFQYIGFVGGELDVSELPLYRPEFNQNAKGKAFQFQKEYLQSLNLPPRNYVELTGEFTKQFVIASGASADHFEESVDGIASVQEHFPRRKFIFFDVGLKRKQRNILLADGGAEAERIFCNVEYRTFNFSRYPTHVRDLHVYSWKFLIIKELLEEFGAVYWMDSSVRFKTGNFMNELELHLRKSNGIALFTQTGHSNYAVTHQDLYNYFPTDVEAQKGVEQWEGGNLLVYNTKELYENVLQWMYYCVLDLKCIAPVKARGCRFQKDRWKTLAGCHRYDQTTVNLLLSNWFGFKTNMYAFTRRSVTHVVRYASKFHTIQWCQPLPSIKQKDNESNRPNEVKLWPRSEL